MDIVNILDTLKQHPAGSFIDLTAFNGANLGACDIHGRSPVWEMHPDTDELFFILEGEFEMTLLDEAQPRTVTAGAGTTFVIPRNVWHKPAAPNGCKFVYFTPGQSLHSDAEDPRGF